MYLTKIFKRQIFNLSYIDGGETYFAYIGGAKINIFGAEGPNIAVFAPKSNYLMHYFVYNYYTKKAIAALNCIQLSLVLQIIITVNNMKHFLGVQ